MAQRGFSASLSQIDKLVKDVMHGIRIECNKEELHATFVQFVAMSYSLVTTHENDVLQAALQPEWPYGSKEASLFDKCVLSKVERYTDDMKERRYIMVRIFEHLASEFTAPIYRSHASLWH